MNGQDEMNDSEMPEIEIVQYEYLTGRDVNDFELNARAADGWLIETMQFMPGRNGGDERLCVVWCREIEPGEGERDEDDLLFPPSGQPPVKGGDGDGDGDWLDDDDVDVDWLDDEAIDAAFFALTGRDE